MLLEVPDQSQHLQFAFGQVLLRVKSAILDLLSQLHSRLAQLYIHLLLKHINDVPQLVQ